MTEPARERDHERGHGRPAWCQNEQQLAETTASSGAEEQGQALAPGDRVIAFFDTYNPCAFGEKSWDWDSQAWLETDRLYARGGGKVQYVKVDSAAQSQTRFGKTHGFIAGRVLDPKEIGNNKQERDALDVVFDGPFLNPLTRGVFPKLAQKVKIADIYRPDSAEMQKPPVLSVFLARFFDYSRNGWDKTSEYKISYDYPIAETIRSEGLVDSVENKRIEIFQLYCKGSECLDSGDISAILRVPIFPCDGFLW